MDGDPAIPRRNVEKPDVCWQCGYNIDDLETGVCPECGTGYPTGRDISHLRDRMRTTNVTQCATCGTPRPPGDPVRCPVCNMRYAVAPGRRSVDQAGQTAGKHQGESRVRGVAFAATAQHAPAQRRRPVRMTRVVPITFGGLMVAIGAVLIADRMASAWPNALVVGLKVAGLLLATAMVGWLFYRLLSRDVQSLQGQLASGPRGWSHRVIDRCPHCGYDTRTLEEPRCPECGLVLLVADHTGPEPR